MTTSFAFIPLEGVSRMPILTTADCYNIQHGKALPFDFDADPEHWAMQYKSAKKELADAMDSIDRDSELCLYDNCITYLDKLPITQAVKDMQYALEADVPNMNQIFDIFWAFYGEAEERVIGNMRPDWLIKFNAIGQEAFARAMKTNPHHCAWSHVPEWYAEHTCYDGMRNGRLPFCFMETLDPCAMCKGSPEACDGCVNEFSSPIDFEPANCGLEL